jgi:formiminoglutamase
LRPSQVVNGRFRGGYITRAYGQPEHRVHALQMELACRAYLDEPKPPFTAATWPPEYSAARAEPVRQVLRVVLARCLDFARAVP